MCLLTLKVRREDAERIFKRWGDMVVKGQVIKTKTLFKAANLLNIEMNEDGMRAISTR